MTNKADLHFVGNTKQEEACIRAFKVKCVTKGKQYREVLFKLISRFVDGDCKFE
jgi:hypothetical protein